MEYRKVFLFSVVVFLSACAGKNAEQPVTAEIEPVERGISDNCSVRGGSRCRAGN